MEITSRQFGQIEAACFALEEATEKNNTALRLVKVIKDNLAEIAKTAYAGELTIDLELEEIELPPGLACPHAKGEPGPVGQVGQVGPSAAKALEGKQVEAIRLYGQEMIAQGAGLKEMIKMVMEHFDLTQDAFAHLIKVNQGSLSKYLRNGARRDAVITGVAEFFGEDGGAIKEDK